MFEWRSCYRAYVNLAHRTDRNQHMKQELARVKFAAERFEAIYTHDACWNREPYKKMFQRTGGAIGCMISHMAVIQRAHDLGCGAIVLEDDLIFATDFIQRLDYIENFVNQKEPDTDVIFLGGTVHINPPWWHGREHEPILRHYCNCNLQRDCERIDDDRMVRVYGMFSTHAYIIPYEKIPKILGLLNATISVSIGIDFSFIIHQPNLKCFAYLPGSVIQRDDISDIGDGMTIFSGFKMLGDHWFADKSDDFKLDKYNFGEAHKR